MLVSPSANTTLYPYLAVHMQALGFGADKAGVLLAITPLVAIMGPPVAGAIADKLGNFKVSHSACKHANRDSQTHASTPGK